MMWLFFMGCVTLYHQVDVGWVSGPSEDGAAHGAMVAYNIVAVPDGEYFGVGGALSFLDTDHGEKSATAEAVGFAELWTPPINDTPFGWHVRGDTLQFIAFPIPTGLSLRTGPHVEFGEHGTRISVDAMGRVAAHVRPIVHWGTIASLRWELGLLIDE